MCCLFAYFPHDVAAWVYFLSESSLKGLLTYHEICDHHGDVNKMLLCKIIFLIKSLRIYLLFFYFFCFVYLFHKINMVILFHWSDLILLIFSLFSQSKPPYPHTSNACWLWSISLKTITNISNSHQILNILKFWNCRHSKEWKITWSKQIKEATAL